MPSGIYCTAVARSATPRRHRIKQRVRASNRQRERTTKTTPSRCPPRWTGRDRRHVDVLPGARGRPRTASTPEGTGDRLQHTVFLSREKRREVEPVLASLPVAARERTPDSDTNGSHPAPRPRTRRRRQNPRPGVARTGVRCHHIPRVASTRVRVVLLAGLLPVLLVAAYFSTRADIARPLAFVLSAFVTASIVAAPRAAKPIE